MSGQVARSVGGDQTITMVYGDRVTVCIFRTRDEGGEVAEYVGEAVRHGHDPDDWETGGRLALGRALKAAGADYLRSGWQRVREADAAKEAKAGIDAILDAAKVHEHVGKVTGSMSYAHLIGNHGFHVIELALASDDDLKVIHRTAHFPDPEARYTTTAEPYMMPLNPPDRSWARHPCRHDKANGDAA